MKYYSIIILVLLYSLSCFSQVGVGTKDPSQAAVLHIADEGGGKGVLIPAVDDLTVIDGNLKNLTSEEQEQAVGMTVFLTTNKRFYTWDGTNWICISPFTATGDPDNFSNSDTNITLSAPYETLEAELRGNFEGTAKLDGDFTGTNSEFNGYGSVPLGAILMWSGNLASLPDGWALCDGRTSNGYKTPDLRGRFVVGYGTSYVDKGSGAVSSEVWDSDYTTPGNLSTGGTTVGNQDGFKKVSLTETQVAPHEHDVIEYAHNHSITGEIMQKDGSSTKEVVAIDTRADVGHGNVTYNNKIGATITGVQVKRGGGIYTYDEIPNPPYRIPTCNIWRYTCTTTSYITFQASTDLTVYGTSFSQEYTSVELPSVPGEYGYRVCTPSLGYCGLGYSDRFVSTSFDVSSCTENSDYDSGNPQCLSEHHDPSVPVGETIRINESWSVEAHENRPPYYVLAFIMRVR